MENATKALLIAAGVFFGLIVLTAAIFAYTQVVNYYRQEDEMIRTEQVIKFNRQYDAYIRDDVRGNELLSIINKIVDYNRRQADAEGIKFERMIIEINLSGKKSEFKYPKKYDVQNKDIIMDFSNTTNDTNIAKISDIMQTIKNNTGVNYTETQLQRLVADISNIFAPEDFSSTEISHATPSYLSACQKRNTVVKNTIGKEYDSLSDAEKKALKEATLEYYQFQRFKRAHFDCEKTKVRYNQGTGRIVKLVFKFNGEFE
ncbi:MAG: hypothetical protein HFJ48_04530 [Clostridia bacterium]|nr:hypothetical protein [Clostridia bacterium]